MAVEKPLVASRLLWFLALWAGGVVAVTIVGFAIKLALGH